MNTTGSADDTVFQFLDSEDGSGCQNVTRQATDTLEL